MKEINLRFYKNLLLTLVLLLLVACGNNIDSIVDLSMEEFKEELSETTMGASILRQDEGYVKMSIPATENRNLDKYYKIEGKDLKRISDDDFDDLDEPSYHEKKGEIIKE